MLVVCIGYIQIHTLISSVASWFYDARCRLARKQLFCTLPLALQVPNRKGSVCISPKFCCLSVFTLYLSFNNVALNKIDGVWRTFLKVNEFGSKNYTCESRRWHIARKLLQGSLGKFLFTFLPLGEKLSCYSGSFFSPNFPKFKVLNSFFWHCHFA